MHKNHFIIAFIALFFLSFTIVNATILNPVLYLNFSQTSGDITNLTGTASWNVPNNQGIDRNIPTLMGNGFNFTANNQTQIIKINNATWNSIDGKDATFIILFSDEFPGTQGDTYFGKGGSFSNNGLLYGSSNVNGRGRLESNPNTLTGNLASTPGRSWDGATDGSVSSNCIIILYNNSEQKIQAHKRGILFYLNGSRALQDDLAPFNLTLTTPISNSDLFNLTLGGSTANASATIKNNGTFVIDEFVMYQQELTLDEAYTMCANWTQGINPLTATVQEESPPSSNNSDDIIRNATTVMFFLALMGSIIIELFISKENKIMFYNYLVVLIIGVLIIAVFSLL